ncbi:MAG TPA: NADPH:quinone oxidoreductase family protein [Dehalococcoidia bacterium]|nr:NADPH:quinone oxidoreductase family protein [Dehalococcoidia bacterium]
MKAIRFHEIGGPEVLRYEDAGEPAPGNGEVLIRVRAAGVNFADTMTTEGRYYLRPRFPQIPGLEVAGEVEALGPGASGLLPGERVMAVLPEGGGYAEKCVARVEYVTPIPAGLDYTEAAALPVQAVTADQVLHVAGRVRPGEWVLVHSAAGGTGSFLVQLAKLAGARVIATAGSKRRLELAADLGADALVDYSDPSWPDQVKEITGGRGADVIVESVGGDVFEASLRCLAPFGRLVEIGQSAGPPPPLNPLRLMRLNQAVVGYYLMTAMEVPELMAATRDRLARALASGRLRIVIGEVAPLADAAAVHRRMLARETQGKVVLIP